MLLIFGKWYEETYKKPIESIIDVGMNKMELASIYNQYEAYKASYPLTKTFDESYTYLSNHSCFNGAFDKCFSILGEKTDKPIMVEVDMFYHEDSRLKRAHFPEYDLLAKNYEEAVIQLAHLVESNVQF